MGIFWTWTLNVDCAGVHGCVSVCPIFYVYTFKHIYQCDYL